MQTPEGNKRKPGESQAEYLLRLKTELKTNILKKVIAREQTIPSKDRRSEWMKGILAHEEEIATNAKVAITMTEEIASKLGIPLENFKDGVPELTKREVLHLQKKQYERKHNEKRDLYLMITNSGLEKASISDIKKLLSKGSKKGESNASITKSSQGNLEDDFKPEIEDHPIQDLSEEMSKLEIDIDPTKELQDSVSKLNLKEAKSVTRDDTEPSPRLEVEPYDIKIITIPYRMLSNSLLEVIPVEKALYRAQKRAFVSVDIFLFTSNPIMDFAVPTTPLLMLTCYKKMTKAVTRTKRLIRQYINVIRTIETSEDKKEPSKRIKWLKKELVDRASEHPINRECFENEIHPFVKLSPRISKQKEGSKSEDQDVVNVLDDDCILAISDELACDDKSRRLIAVNAYTDYADCVSIGCPLLKAGRIWRNLVKEDIYNISGYSNLLEFEMDAMTDIDIFMKEQKKEMSNLCDRYGYKPNKREDYSSGAYESNLIPEEMLRDCSSFLLATSINVIHILEVTILRMIRFKLKDDKEFFNFVNGRDGNKDYRVQLLSEHDQSAILNSKYDILHLYPVLKDRTESVELKASLKAVNISAITEEENGGEKTEKKTQKIDLKEARMLIPKNISQIPTRKEATVYVDWMLENIFEDAKNYEIGALTSVMPDMIDVEHKRESAVDKSVTELASSATLLSIETKNDEHV